MPLAIASFDSFEFFRSGGYGGYKLARNQPYGAQRRLEIALSHRQSTRVSCCSTSPRPV